MYNMVVLTAFPNIKCIFLFLDFIYMHHCAVFRTTRLNSHTGNILTGACPSAAIFVCISITLAHALRNADAFFVAKSRLRICRLQIHNNVDIIYGENAMYETAFECDGWLLIGRSKATVFFRGTGVRSSRPRNTRRR